MANVIGQRILRREDPRFLRGEGTYVENLEARDALHVVFVRSPFAHARVLGIDASAATGGQVFTTADLDVGPFPTIGWPGLDRSRPRPLLAADTVRYVGEIVAVVAADSRAAAADAAELVFVDYDPLPAVVDPAVAADDEANVCYREEQPAEGLFDGCEVVVSGRVVSQRLAPSPLEPRSALARVEDGRLVAWLSTQTPHQDCAGLARMFGLEPEDVRVVGPDVGGGFGAKGLSVEDVLVAWLARSSGRPARWTETRSENMVAMAHSRASILDVELGGTREGIVQAYRLRILADAGAYPGIGAILPAFTSLMASGVYRIPRIEIDARSVLTNTTPTGAFRGAGRPEATQAIERAIDLFAAELGLDPADVRRRNFVPPDAFPYTTASGAVYDSGDYAGALELALEAVGYDELRTEQAQRDGAQRLGIGLSTYVEVTNGGSESEFGEVEITAEGGAILRTGSFSHGQGHETTFAMIVAERLGLPLESVAVVKGDTDQVARGTGTYGSKSTQIGGVVAGLAAEQVAERARQLAADLLEVSVEDLVFDERFQVAGAPSRSLSWGELAERATEAGRLAELRVELDFKPDTPTFPFGAHVAVVEVDTETGQVELLRHVAVDDAGTIISPVIAEGQVHGGVATGIAQALFEEMVYDEEGNPLTLGFANYAFPSAGDLPSFELVKMATPTPINPLGAKGIGESGTIGATPAVQNAVVDALRGLGVRHIDMPLTPERVWRALAGD
ncbi:MAG TPA: xanthine dehydrogenase family protein molybdopterin-binding subunit [Gaiellaceae bacterium]|nr:xanthine dehydrogenase family protein molybdopterin-binding subunit [Gaiellaceae bacterium]